MPTHNAVTWYGTIDGYTWEDRERSAKWDEENPYANRDPRLRQNIFCDGDDILTSGNILKMDASRTGNVRTEMEKNSNLFTGYISNKYLWPGQHTGGVKMTQTGKNDGQKVTNGIGAQKYLRCLAYIRIPQLYLDFAEAANELYGPTGQVTYVNSAGETVTAPHTAVSAINVIRKRVGQNAKFKLNGNDMETFPQLADVPSLYTGDKGKFREYIRLERGAELFQEFHRWFDIRRWKIAVDLFSDKDYIKGIDIYELNGVTVYEPRSLASEGVVRVFEPKHYWYPFPSDDMFKLGSFEQNPGW